jgi:signal transduction histidine kinase
MESPIRIRKAIAIRVSVAVGVIAALTVAGLIITYRVADGQRQDYFTQRKVQATTAAAALDYRDIEALNGTPDDLNSVAYQRLRQQLVRIKRSDMHIRFVYLMRPSGKNMIFLVDAEDPSSPDFSPPGQVYEEAKPSDFYVFEGKQKPDTLIEGPVHDRWGTWMSASAYVTNGAASPIAVLGTDVEVERALDSFNQTRHLGTVFGMLAAALMVLVALQWILWQYNRDKREVLRVEMEASSVRLNEELIKAVRMKSDFIQLASHELRSPVNAVNVAIQTLDRTASERLNHDDKTLIQVARNGSTRLVDLVDNLLDMTRVEAGDYVFKPSKADPAELVSKTVELFEPLAAKKNIGLTARLPEQPVEAVIDPQALLRVLENLVSNAIKFTDYGGVVVEMKAAGDKLRYSVQDTGAGIPDSFKDELFKKFTKLERPSEYRQQGAGMGLALCKSLVESQGGRIWFDSTEGTGTTFYFEIPRVQAVPEPDEAAEPADE